jgi:hypothetical protein
MNDYVKNINIVRSQIKKLESDFKRGIPPYFGFTIDISYGGNSENDLERITIGSVSDDEDISKRFYEMVLNSLNKSLSFWEKAGEQELIELQKCLYK